MGKPMVNDHYPIIHPVDPGRSQIPQLFPMEKRDEKTYAPLLRRFDHRLGVAMPAAPGSSFDVYGTLGHLYYYYYSY